MLPWRIQKQRKEQHIFLATAWGLLFSMGTGSHNLCQKKPSSKKVCKAFLGIYVFLKVSAPNLSLLNFFAINLSSQPFLGHPLPWTSHLRVVNHTLVFTAWLFWFAFCNCRMHHLMANCFSFTIAIE